MDGAVVGLLRRAGQRDGLHAGGLRRHDVHQHARDQRCQTAGHVEPDPADRHLAVGHARAGAEVRDGILLELGGTGRAQPTDRFLETGPDGGVELVECGGQRLRGHPDVVDPHPVEPLAEAPDRVDPTGADLLADRMHRRHRGFDVEVGAGHGCAVVGC